MLKPLKLGIAPITVKDLRRQPRRGVESCDATRHPHPSSAMDPTTTSSPALSMALTVLAVLLALTGFGVYQAFGPPSKGLTDPFDDHDD